MNARFLWLATATALGVAAAELSTGAQFRSDVQLVPLTVTVTNKAGRYVPGLTAADFTILEDGRPQSISHFAATDSPLDLSLLLDSSASMSRVLPVAQEAACGLVRRLKADDRGAVAGITTSISDAQQLTSDSASLEQAILSMRADGATALYEGIYILLREFERGSRGVSRVRRQAMVVLSDGLDTASRIAFEDMLDEVRRANVAIHVVLLTQESLVEVLPGQARYVAQSAYRMRELARESGGRVFNPRSPRELPAIYDTIGHELNSQYVLGYTPTRQDSDGSYRRISVRVQHPDAAYARTRAGYYARAQRRIGLSPSTPQ